jgi:hypothetical protein
MYLPGQFDLDVAADIKDTMTSPGYHLVSVPVAETTQAILCQCIVTAAVHLYKRKRRMKSSINPRRAQQ